MKKKKSKVQPIPLELLQPAVNELYLNISKHHGWKLALGLFTLILWNRAVEDHEKKP